MRDTLTDMVRYLAPHFSVVKVTGTDDNTKFEAHTDDKTLFVQGKLKEAESEFKGEFGIGNLNLLKGLLDFPSYKADDAKFKVHRSVKEGDDIVSEFEFREKSGAGTRFRTMSGKMVAEQAKISNIPWELNLTLSKAKIAEISQLASLFSDVKKFSLAVEDKNLVMVIGGGSEVTHTATVSINEGVDEKLVKEKLYYDTPNFLAVLKNTGNAKAEINICSRGVIGITAETEKGVYTYYVRGSQA